MAKREQRILLALLLAILIVAGIVGAVLVQQDLSAAYERGAQIEQTMIESRNATIDAESRSP